MAALRQVVVFCCWVLQSGWEAAGTGWWRWMRAQRGGKERERVFGLPRGKTSGRAGGMNWNDTEAGCVRRSPLRGWVAVVQVAVYPGAG